MFSQLYSRVNEQDSEIVVPAGDKIRCPFLLLHINKHQLRMMTVLIGVSFQNFEYNLVSHHHTGVLII